MTLRVAVNSTSIKLSPVAVDAQYNGKGNQHPLLTEWVTTTSDAAGGMPAHVSVIG